MMDDARRAMWEREYLMDRRAGSLYGLIIAARELHHMEHFYYPVAAELILRALSGSVPKTAFPPNMLGDLLLMIAASVWCKDEADRACVYDNHVFHEVPLYPQQGGAWVDPEPFHKAVLEVCASAWSYGEPSMNQRVAVELGFMFEAKAERLTWGTELDDAVLKQKYDPLKDALGSRLLLRCWGLSLEVISTIRRFHGDTVSVGPRIRDVLAHRYSGGYSEHATGIIACCAGLMVGAWVGADLMAHCIRRDYGWHSHRWIPESIAEAWARHGLGPFLCTEDVFC